MVPNKYYSSILCPAFYYCACMPDFGRQGKESSPAFHYNSFLKKQVNSIIAKSKQKKYSFLMSH